MKIIYLHGFNSDGNGRTAQKLKEIYKKNILTPSYDYSNADKGFKYINNLILETFKKDPEVILVGTSLGGFWANILAEKYDLKCVLINPSLNPSKSLKKYLGENKNFSNNKIIDFTEANANSYRKYEKPVNKNIFRITLLGENDKVIDQDLIKKMLTETVVYKVKNEGHSFVNVEPIIEAIEKCNNTMVESIIAESGYNLIVERFVNIQPNDLEKRVRYATPVWDMLQKSYAPIGGIHGSGFNSKEDMIKNIPFWKLATKNDKLVAVAMYKDKAGRKRVAVGTDGTPVGKEMFKTIAKDDVKHKRSYGEFSGPSLAFQIKNIDNIKDHVIPVEKVEKIVGEEIKQPPADDPELLKFPALKDFFYQRKVGNDWHTKIMIGEPYNPIQ